MSRWRCLVLPIGLGLAIACSGESEEGDAATVEETSGEVPSVEEPALDTPEGKIASAESAAPADVATNATIMDWPAEEGGAPTELRAGTNGWTCFPSTPTTAGSADEDPMCLDAEWLEFAQAWMGRTEPSVSAVGVGYMLQGDKGVSNIDPYATAPTADNQWVTSGPHLMIITPDAAALEIVSADPTNGGPWVMWAGTPYAHIMVPVESPSTR